MKGTVFIISAPSGAGKTTLCDMLLARYDQVRFAVSHTTRPPRGEERDGVAYHFITLDEFDKIKQANGFLEWARVHGHYYGTSAAEVYDTIARGEDILLDIDYQGAFQVKQRLEKPVLIFITPPSIAVLEQRLRSRGLNEEDEIRRRLIIAAKEMSMADQYDYVVVNDDLDDAFENLSSIFAAERKRRQ
jgi:guanylate kinase